jgi:hypothetical protein
MRDLYAEIEPHAQGMLEITGGDLVYWEVCGNPRGSRLFSYTAVPARSVRRGIGGCSILLRIALCCLINVVVGGAGLMRATGDSVVGEYHWKSDLRH